MLVKIFRKSLDLNHRYRNPTLYKMVSRRCGITSFLVIYDSHATEKPYLHKVASSFKKGALQVPCIKAFLKAIFGNYSSSNRV